MTADCAKQRLSAKYSGLFMIPAILKNYEHFFLNWILKGRKIHDTNSMNA